MVGSPTVHGQTLPLLLGLASPQGRLSLDSQRKLAQVAGMLPWLRRALTGRSSPTVIEFGCGRAYLSFFLAQGLREEEEARAHIIGVDRSAALIDRCRRVRDLLAWPEMDFHVATCEAFHAPPPTLVCSLHACDIATDHVIAAAIDMSAEQVVVAPCCHSTNQRRLREAGHRHEWGRVARCFPLLGSRFSEFVTEAMRCLALRAHGYQVQVREFVSGTATPKNLLITAARISQPSRRSADELHRIEDLLGLDSEVERSLERRRASGGSPQH